MRMQFTAIIKVMMLLSITNFEQDLRNSSEHSDIIELKSTILTLTEKINLLKYLESMLFALKPNSLDL